MPTLLVSQIEVFFSLEHNGFLLDCRSRNVDAQEKPVWRIIPRLCARASTYVHRLDIWILTVGRWDIVGTLKKGCSRYIKQKDRVFFHVTIPDVEFCISVEFNPRKSIFSKCDHHVFVLNPLPDLKANIKIYN